MLKVIFFLGLKAKQQFALQDKTIIRVLDRGLVLSHDMDCMMQYALVLILKFLLAFLQKIRCAFPIGHAILITFPLTLPIYIE